MKNEMWRLTAELTCSLQTADRKCVVTAKFPILTLYKRNLNPFMPVFFSEITNIKHMNPPIGSKLTISFKSDREEGKFLWNVSDIDSDIGITNIAHVRNGET